MVSILYIFIIPITIFIAAYVAFSWTIAFAWMASPTLYTQWPPNVYFQKPRPHSVLLAHVHTMNWISPFAHISYQWMSTWPSPISKAETWPSPGFLPFSLSPSPGGPQTLPTPSPHSSRILESPLPMAFPHHLSHPDHGNGRSALPSCAFDHCSSSTFLRMAIHSYKERSQNRSLIWAGRERRDPSGHR